MYSIEEIRKGAQVFFALLKNKILPYSDSIAQDYYNSVEVREIVKDMAQEGGLRVFETRENIHLVTSPHGSMFANSYTQMREKYKALERKKYFYLANIIICIYLAEVDMESYIRIRWEEQGVSYAKLEDIVTKTLESWMKRQSENQEFAKDWGIALEQIYDLWMNEFSLYKENQITGRIDVVNTKGTRYSFIHEALKPLTDQGLIYDNTRELKIIPRNELYERLDYHYHSQERYMQIKEMIRKTREEENNAENE
ncbi:MAG: hypothetical protein GX045_05565 [Clostridiaceae bacterium]|jgi:hypothetical protein|nr:hypothetical protein [Clostridiaceae bacterium]